jgi:hypothetical protein
MPGGFEALFFASSEAERHEAMAVLGALKESSVEFGSAEDLASFVEEQAPALQALADWIRNHQDALIAALIPTIATVLVALVLQQDSISAEELDRILEHNSRPEVIVINEDADETDTHPSKQRRDEHEVRSRVGDSDQLGRRQDEKKSPPDKS